MEVSEWWISGRILRCRRFYDHKKWAELTLVGGFGIELERLRLFFSVGAVLGVALLINFEYTLGGRAIKADLDFLFLRLVTY